MEKEVEEDVNPSESAARVFKQMEEKGIRKTLCSVSVVKIGGGYG